MKTFFPLITHTDPAAPIAYRARRRLTAREFLADVARLAASLPAGAHMLNVCADRYRFMVGLAAAMSAGKISLLPSTHTPEAVRQLRAFAPDAFCLSDHRVEIDLPQVRYADEMPVESPGEPFKYPGATLSKVSDAFAVPQFSAQQIIAYVFTSGSTGTPVAHAKCWGDVVGSVRAEAARLDILDGPAFTLVGTVPPQHMYGLESTVLLAMQGGGALWAGRPFYAADIAAALASVPAPRILVSTPFHLRAFFEAQTQSSEAQIQSSEAQMESSQAPIECPPLRCVLSATAPLSADSARHIESVSGAPLMEIYGSTESGQIASRRTAHDEHWLLLDGLRLRRQNDGTFVAGAFIAGEIALGDIIELHGAREFSLHGRSGDLINIAGKRTSLGFLNHQLLAIGGVKDGVFFFPEERERDDTGRLAAFAVAPELDAKAIVQALRERIDPLFLPRPLLLVPQLPRNGAGKLPRAELLALWRRERGGKSREAG